MQAFGELFRVATRHAPHGYRARLARDGLPDEVQAPTRAGKTGVILTWPWRRLCADPDSTLRRLVYAPQQRSLVEQLAGGAGRWLSVFVPDV
jgi:hypothetical protein